MANLSITPSNVVPGATAATVHYNPPNLVAGEAIAAGEVVCLLASDGKAYKADANDADKRNVIGIAGNSAAAAGQRVDVISQAAALPIGTHGVAVGIPYFLSATAGKLCPLADLASGDLPVLCAYITSSTELQVVLAAALAAKP